MSFFLYLKDTRGELRHVAWPTRLQTIVYTVLVALISIAVSLYLGLFDYLFTTGLSRFLQVFPAFQAPLVEIPGIATGTMPVIEATSTLPTDNSPQFKI
ncbi:preprotein translocase subunit SecE [Candidatus Kaiserbacteria bacterium RIFCSPLOWO2_12_FULL_53_8]|uniref:Protein translocase subunit SecE n=2 Tax=Candidatus Kaiseribacteriota TaxID=1752734 RepID=A0A1F6CT94_9BACT|nr:MAG: preprotein translocase subunit SecE [Candidatus Kaiserbacteria bacterium RIFCSPHIGHO2_01_FULL_53_29]OGG90896.1 MAG: preprotein translocase subunit SecE [Candidatus Kaiserbacteria bacterium RIFCSPLOWO2_12_FULL_53_8]